MVRLRMGIRDLSLFSGGGRVIIFFPLVWGRVIIFLTEYFY